MKEYVLAPEDKSETLPPDDVLRVGVEMFRGVLVEVSGTGKTALVQFSEDGASRFREANPGLIVDENIRHRHAS